MFFGGMPEKDPVEIVDFSPEAFGNMIRYYVLPLMYFWCYQKHMCFWCYQSYHEHISSTSGQLPISISFYQKIICIFASTDPSKNIIQGT